MGLAIKNNQLTGTFNSGEEWRVKLSIKPSEGAFVVYASLLVNNVYQMNVCESYEKGGYRVAIQSLLVKAEKSFGVKLLKSVLKVAV